MLTYKTETTWRGGHLGEISCSNGVVVSFSAPKDLHGQPNVLTPEDAFVGALNMCFQLMFLWSAEKMKIDLVSYRCTAIGAVEELLDRTSTFKRITLNPKIEVRNSNHEQVRRALKLAEKYSLIAQSVKAEVTIEPEILIIN